MKRKKNKGEYLLLYNVMEREKKGGRYPTATAAQAFFFCLRIPRE